ncbi:hypothetical protein Mal64_10670 [Pseudobythopirellula maris]|uniref:Uncharacterized protein n=1 Tax=Pseudobythopirellula maris TaxID=2527991 RepID=A0A5C5ZT01_9BACT|nr:hypothetical protein [Pseudobythopirellula maris]TWT90672.1 hypothetical protein Mal64_10670 [Pseudobythopirellula maris]
MMTRAANALIAATILCLSAPSVGSAFWLEDCYNHLEQGRRENQAWPMPYVCPDRRHAYAPFDAMIANGTRRQNLLGSHHFNEDATQLTQAGKLRVHWILTQQPEGRRQVFIEPSMTAATTEARVAAARDFAQGLGTGAEVNETTILSDGRPAVVVDYVNTKFRENMLIPALPTNTYNMDDN